jgi:hypothetical protein
LLSDRSGLISFLHDEVAGPGRDDRLEIRKLVAGDDDEPARVRADLFVFVNGELDELVAPQAGALTPEADRRVLVPGPLAALDALVDVADGRLVGGGVPLLLALHSGMFSRCERHLGGFGTTEEREGAIRRPA